MHESTFDYSRHNVYALLVAVCSFQTQFKMPRKVCCNPFKVHEKQVTKDLRAVTLECIRDGIVKEGDLICRNCSALSSDKSNPKVQAAHAAVATTMETHSSNTDCTQAELETSSEEEGAEDPSSQTSHTDTARSALNKALPALGVSPIKRRNLSHGQKVTKIRKKLRAVQEGLEDSYGANLPERMEYETSERLDGLTDDLS